MPRSSHDLDAFDRSDRTALEWVDTVAEHLGTEDRDHAYRVLRAWLRIVRDRLTVDGAAHAAAQLPLLLRGLFYDGWMPSHVPVKYDADQFLLTLAQDARISLDEARRAAPAVTAALVRRCSPGQIDHVLAQLPAPLRQLLAPAAQAQPSEATAKETRAAAAPTEGPPLSRSNRQADRFDDVEQKLDTVLDAVRTLIRGLEEHPSEEPHPERVTAAARRAHQILLAIAPPPPGPPARS
jgi:uncharacterized protein (DUF2267 family)